MIETLLQDIRYALRSLAAHRGSAVLAVLCLTLGIGTNAAVFTFVNALLLRPVPVAEPEELLVVREARREAPESGEPASYANFRDWQQAVADVAELAALRTVSVRLADGGPPERYAAALVSSNLFSVLGIQPLLGRGFLAEDFEGNTPAVLVSHALWQQRFEADPRLLGRAVTINGVAYRVVGVMPPAASALAIQPVLRGSKLWLPLDPSERASRRDQRRLTVYARPHDGVTVEATRVRLVTAARTLEDAFRAENEGWGVSLQPLRIGFSTTTRTLLWMVMGAVTFVLLIACTNVANLTLARATGRRHEMATQLALGAPSVRIVRQLLIESLIVAGASVPLGIAVANWCRQMLLSSVATPDMAAGISIDRQVLAFIVGLAVLSTAGSGLAPALVVLRRLSANTFSMRGDRQGAALPHAYVTKALLIGEVALSIVLLVGASLFLQSFRNLLAAEGGFDTSRILVARVGMTEEGEPPDESSAPRVFGLVDRLRNLPGVEVGAAANLMPLRDGGIRGVVVPDQMVSGDAKAPAVLLGGITADFFAALDVPLLQGRRFTDAEGRSRAPVAIVNKTMARRFWPDGNAVGRSFRRLVDGRESSFIVVGVSEDILTWDLERFS